MVWRMVIFFLIFKSFTLRMIFLEIVKIADAKNQPRSQGCREGQCQPPRPSNSPSPPEYQVCFIKSSESLSADIEKKLETQALASLCSTAPFSIHPGYVAAKNGNYLNSSC